jgi:hypothetical protein
MARGLFSYKPSPSAAQNELLPPPFLTCRRFWLSVLELTFTDVLGPDTIGQCQR